MRKRKPVKIGKQHELDVCERTGMTRIPGSGSGAEKEDLIDDKWLVQCKCTLSNSKSVSLDDWHALEFHAVQAGKIPRMEFRIGGCDFVMVSASTFDRLVNE